MATNSVEPNYTTLVEGMYKMFYDEHTRLNSLDGTQRESTSRRHFKLNPTTATRLTAVCAATEQSKSNFALPAIYARMGWWSPSSNSFIDDTVPPHVLEHIFDATKIEPGNGVNTSLDIRIPDTVSTTINVACECLGVNYGQYVSEALDDAINNIGQKAIEQLNDFSNEDGDGEPSGRHAVIDDTDDVDDDDIDDYDNYDEEF